MCFHRSYLQPPTSCTLCGAFFDPSKSVEGNKSPKYFDNTILDPECYLKNIRRKADNFCRLRDPQTVVPAAALKLIDKILTKFEFNELTLARSIYLLLHLLEKKPELQCRSMSYGAVCLYIAAKCTENRASVPRLSRYVRYCCEVFTKEDYDDLEDQVFDILENDTKFMEVGLFLDFLNFYLANGICFSNEQEVEPERLQKQALARASDFIRSGQFFHYQQERLAAYILYQTRREAMVSEIWNEHIEHYTGISTFQIYNIIKEHRKKPVVSYGKSFLNPEVGSPMNSPLASTSAASIFGSRSVLISPINNNSNVRTVRYFLSPLKDRNVTIKTRESSKETTCRRTVVHA